MFPSCLLDFILPKHIIDSVIGFEVLEGSEMCTEPEIKTIIVLYTNLTLYK